MNRGGYWFILRFMETVMTRDEKENRVLFKGSKFDIELKGVVGRSGERFEKPYIRHPGAVVLIPETSDGGLILIENKRFAIEQFLIEVPAGTLHWGEEPLAAAHRELEEETGWKAGRCIPILTYYSAPAFTDEVMHVFLAQDLERGQWSPDDDEEIRVHIYSASEVETLEREGKIRDGKTLLALSLWRKHRGV